MITAAERWTQSGAQRRDPRRRRRERDADVIVRVDDQRLLKLCGRDCLGYSTSIGRPSDGQQRDPAALEPRPATPRPLSVWVAAHELGHVLGLHHRKRPQLLGDVAARVRHQLRAVAGRLARRPRTSWPACRRRPTSTSPPGSTAAPRPRAIRAANNLPRRDRLTPERASAPRSSPRCRRSPCRPARSTSARASRTRTGPPRCSRPRRRRSATATTSTRRCPACPRCARRSPSTSSASTGSSSTRTEVQVTMGATEAITAAVLGLCEPGDEVLAFDPTYDSYGAAAKMTGARLVPVPLHPPEWTFDPDELAAAVTPQDARDPRQLAAQPDRPRARSRASCEPIADAVHRARPDRDHRRGLRAPRLRRARAHPAGHAARDGRAHADDLLARQDVQRHGLEGRLGDRAGAARRRACAPPSSS